MKSINMLALAAATIALTSLPSVASPLVYKPINPSFGGDPLNGSWLFSQASAQTDSAGAPGFTIDFPDLGLVDEGDDTAEQAEE
ncbi:curli assembly protein CsgF [Pelagibacterium mangrovi]|uniref:curli assembly protein CsgF n=1 Tax=Pelagibacterium mangrovi TaxID=3119828 RepID=UPI002FCA3028